MSGTKTIEKKERKKKKGRMLVAHEIIEVAG